MLAATAIIQLFVAIFKAFPSIENLIKTALEERDKQRIVVAANRKQEKDRLNQIALDKAKKSAKENGDEIN